MPPVYEYRCRGCGNTREVSAVEHRIARAAGVVVTCRRCPSTMKRVWSANVATATVAGFYAHDRSRSSP